MPRWRAGPEFGVTISMLSGRSIKLKCRSRHKVSFLLAQARVEFNLLFFEECHLVYQDTMLHLGQHVRTYGIEEGSELRLVLSSEGCGGYLY